MRIRALALAASALTFASVSALADDVVTSKSGYGGRIDARAFATDHVTVDTTVLQGALNYAHDNGIGTVDLGARYTGTITGLTLPPYVKLNLGGQAQGKQTTTRNYTIASGIQGVLGLASSGTIACGVGSGIIHGNILRDGDSYAPTTFYGQTTRDGKNIQSAEAGTAITASSPSCQLQDLSILGFDKAVALSSQHVKVVDVFADARTCWSLNGAEDDQFDRVICKSLLTQGLDRQSAILYLNEVGGSDHQYEFTWDVSATTYTLTNGDKFYFVPASGGGAESAAGGWTISNAATRQNFEKGCNRAAGCPGGTLTGSSKTATVLSASWSASADAAGDYYVTVTPGTVGTVSKGQAVAGTGIASGTTVAAVWNDQGRIYLSPLAPATNPFTQAGSGVSLTFTDHAFTSANTGFVENGERAGAGFDCVNSSGIKVTDSTSFSHGINWHFGDGCRNIRVEKPTSGTNDASLDDGQIIALIDGNHTGNDADSITFSNCNCGQHAQVGFKINSDSNKPNFISMTNAAPGAVQITGTSLDVEDGKVVIEGLNTGGAAANVFIADQAHVTAHGITNALTHFYMQTPFGDALDGSNNQCSVPVICNHSATLDVAALTSNGHGIPSPIATQFTANTSPFGGVSNFLPFNSTSAPAQTEAQVRSYAPYAGTIRNLQVRINSATGSGHSVAVTLRQGSSGGSLSDSTLTCAIANPNLLCSDLTHSVAVAQGDYIDWSITYDSTFASGGRVNITAEYDGPSQ